MNNRESFWEPKSKLSKKQIIEKESDHSGEDNDIEEKNIFEAEIGEKIPEGLIDADDFIKENGEEYASEVYEYYRKAMTRKDREALEEDRFLSHFFYGGSSEKNYLFGDGERGYLLGVSKYGAFIPTHFAPKSIRTGVDLIKELGANKNLPVAMAITEDLESMMKKIPGWTSLDTDFLSQFRGMTVNKKIVHNEHPDIYKLAVGLLNDYIEEQREWENYKDYDDFDENEDENADLDY